MRVMHRAVITVAWAGTAVGHLAGLLQNEVSTFFIAAAAVVTIVWTQQARADAVSSSVRALGERVDELSRRVDKMGEQLRKTVNQINERALSVDRLYGLGVVHDKLAELRACRDQANDEDLGTGPFHIYQAGR